MEAIEVIMAHIEAHWVEWLFLAISGILGLAYKNIINHQKAEKKKMDAIGNGVEALLRENIVAQYNKYLDRDYCPIYAKESIKRVYKAYHELGGNDVATELYESLLEMPTDKKGAGG